jgi:hypothetical protein
MVLYFMIGSLPWQGLKAAITAHKYRLVLEKKQTIGVADLGGDLPPESTIDMDYVRNFAMRTNQTMDLFGAPSAIFSGGSDLNTTTSSAGSSGNTRDRAPSSRRKVQKRCVERSAASNRKLHQNMRPSSHAGQGSEA